MNNKLLSLMTLLSLFSISVFAEVQTIFIKNDTKHAANVWVNGHLQGKILGKKMYYTEIYGFLGQDNKESHAGWDESGDLKITIVSLREKNRTFWKGVIPNSPGADKEFTIWIGNTEPLASEKEDAEPVIKNGPKSTRIPDFISPNVGTFSNGGTTWDLKMEKFNDPTSLVGTYTGQNNEVLGNINVPELDTESYAFKGTVGDFKFSATRDDNELTIWIYASKQIKIKLFRISKVLPQDYLDSISLVGGQSSFPKEFVGTWVYKDSYAGEERSAWITKINIDESGRYTFERSIWAGPGQPTVNSYGQVTLVSKNRIQIPSPFQQGTTISYDLVGSTLIDRSDSETYRKE